MDEKEKELYSMIFSLTLKISRNSKFAHFAKYMMAMCEEFESKDDDGFTYSWNLLKEYADIVNGDEEEQRWKALVDSADSYCKEHNDLFTRRMVGNVIGEIERRSKEHDGR